MHNVSVCYEVKVGKDSLKIISFFPLPQALAAVFMMLIYPKACI